MNKIQIDNINMDISLFNNTDISWLEAIKFGIAFRLMGRKKIRVLIEESVNKAIQLAIDEAESQSQEYLQ